MSLALEPPGPGVWQLDVSHFARPLTRSVAEILPAAFTAGQTAWIQRYGMPLRSSNFSAPWPSN